MAKLLPLIVDLLRRPILRNALLDSTPDARIKFLRDHYDLGDAEVNLLLREDRPQILQHLWQELNAIDPLNPPKVVKAPALLDGEAGASAGHQVVPAAAAAEANEGPAGGVIDDEEAPPHANRPAPPMYGREEHVAWPGAIALAIETVAPSVTPAGEPFTVTIVAWYVTEGATLTFQSAGLPEVVVKDAQFEAPGESGKVIIQAEITVLAGVYDLTVEQNGVSSMLSGAVVGV